MGLPVKWAKILRLPKSLDDPIFKTPKPIEERDLGVMYGNKVLTEEQLLSVFMAAKTIHDLL